MTTTETKAPSLEEALEEIKHFEDEVCESFVERRPQIHSLLSALIAGEHAVLIGRPGVAKSALVREIAHGMNSSYFELLLTRYTGPDEVFGPVSLKALEQDSYRRMTTGRLPTAEIVFLDEVFKASSAILNSLLAALNERVFHDDGKVIDIPLAFLVGASNELPSGDDSLEAFADRFLVRLEVLSLSSEGARKMLVGLPPCSATLDPAAVQVLRFAVDDVIVNDACLDAMLRIRDAVTLEGIFVSDRRWAKSLRYLKARTLLGGSSTMTTSALIGLRDTLWNRLDEQERLMAIITTHALPWHEELVNVSRLLDEQTKALREISQGGKTSADTGKLAAVHDVIVQAVALVDAVCLKHPDAAELAVDSRRRCDVLKRAVIQAFKERGLL